MVCMFIKEVNYFLKFLKNIILMKYSLYFFHISFLICKYTVFFLSSVFCYRSGYHMNWLPILIQWDQKRFENDE